MSPIVLLAVAALLAPSCVFGQVRAHTQPLSADRVVLEIHIEGETPATVHVRNGQLARVQVGGALDLGLVPVVKDGKIELVVLEILRDVVTGNEGLRQLARYQLGRAIVKRLDGLAPVIDVTWLETLGPATAPSEPSGPCSQCCVTCGNILYCGCVVIAECGSCCCPDACICPFDPEGRLKWNTTGCGSSSAAGGVLGATRRGGRPL